MLGKTLGSSLSGTAKGRAMPGDSGAVAEDFRVGVELFFELFVAASVDGIARKRAMRTATRRLMRARPVEREGRGRKRSALFTDLLCEHGIWRDTEFQGFRVMA